MPSIFFNKMDQVNKYTIKHSLDLRMSTAKEKLKKTKNNRKSRISTVTAEQQRTTLPQRVFLYLHPASITYPLDDVPSGRTEIEVEHQSNTITTLSDHFMPRNVIQVDQFDFIKPTFSITIEQDSLDDITMLSNSPVMLTLYVHTTRKSISGVDVDTSITDKDISDDIRLPVAQGYIDVIEYFDKKRSYSTDTVYLYPLKNSGQSLTCKTEWEIYSLHPILKNTVFSNVLFITMGSLYNINEDLMNDFQNLGVNLSFISKVPDENNEYDKIFICNFKTFTKSIISQQNPTKSWESLKSTEFDNINSMGIASEAKFNINHLFSNHLTTENVEFNFSSINLNEDFALICNSMHRYVLTDTMQRILENVVTQNLYKIIVEIYSEQDKSIILLQGYIDLSIFVYPEVNNSSFVIELRPPDYKHSSQAAAKANPKSEKNKSKRKNSNNSQEQQIKEEKIQFATIQICLNTPITNPPQDINEISDQNYNKYDQCASKITKTPQMSLHNKCAQNYKSFDDLIIEILEYIIQNNNETISDDKEFFCNQIGNLTNKIIKLVACDFNVKIPTKSNIEFTNLITTVYHDLTLRIYDTLNKCSLNGVENCIFTKTDVQSFIITNMSMAKYLYEVGNSEMANFIMNKLRAQYPNNAMLNFYIFLYDIERQHFELVKEYLEKNLDDKDMEGELFVDLIRIYVNYKLQLKDPDIYHMAEENLIEALSYYSINHSPKSLTGWILLYCLYKKYNYQAGMSYCRWKYENLYDCLYVKLEFIPKSLWEIYMPYKIDSKSSKGQTFIKVCDKLLRLGLYNFAELVFKEIAEECLEIEKYFFSKTFQILENKLQIATSNMKMFSVEKLKNPLQLRATLSLVNGNLEYFRKANSENSIKNYQDIVELTELDDYNLYQLGLLRFAYKMLEEEKYNEASRVFQNLVSDKKNCVVAAAERGKACYYLGQLDEAEKCFALSTEYDMCMPNSWAYLALINLKKGNNYKALECWKYYRFNKNVKIDVDIVKELNKIDHNDVFLFVDLPNKH